MSTGINQCIILSAQPEACVAPSIVEHGTCVSEPCAAPNSMPPAGVPPNMPTCAHATINARSWPWVQQHKALVIACISTRSEEGISYRAQN